jgi:hypothetical protein
VIQIPGQHVWWNRLQIWQRATASSRLHHSELSDHYQRLVHGTCLMVLVSWYLCRSHLYMQHRHGMPELHLVLLVPSSDVEQSGETTVRAPAILPMPNQDDRV